MSRDEHIAADGRVFHRLATIPYVRKDGSETQIVVWNSGCVVCGRPFTVATPVDFSTTKVFGRKHCGDHKLTKQEVTDRWQAGIRKAKAQKKANLQK